MKKRKSHAPEQIVAKLREAVVMLNSGKDIESYEICEWHYRLRIIEKSDKTHDWLIA